MTVRAAASLAVAALTLAACGSEGDDTGGQPSATATATADLTPYREAANQVCREFAEANDRLESEVGVPADLTAQARYDAQLAEAADIQARAFAALDPPPGVDHRADHEALTETYRETAAAYRDAARIAGDGDAKGYQAATRRRQQIGNEQLRLARALSADTCSRALPAETRDAITTLTRRVLLGQTPERSCADDITPVFLASNLGGSRASCLKILRGLATDGATVQVRYITGVDRLFATTNVAFSEARGAPPKRLSYDLSWDEAASSWRFDSAYDPEALVPAEAG